MSALVKKQVYVQLPTWADNVALPAFAAACHAAEWQAAKHRLCSTDRHCLLDSPTAANLQQWRAAAECWDRQTDARQLHRPCSAYYAGSTNMLNNDARTHTHPFKGPFSGTTRVSWYQKGKTNLDFTEARDSEWQWHQLGHMQVCTKLLTDNHASPTNSVKALKANNDARSWTKSYQQVGCSDACMHRWIDTPIYYRETKKLENIMPPRP